MKVGNETGLVLQLLTERAKAKVEAVKQEELGSGRGQGFEKGARWVIDEAKRIVDVLEKEA